MQYLMWRVLTGLHHTITISFMVVGHTKFAPDGCFGLLKRTFRKTEVSSLSDIKQVIRSSSVVNECQLVGSQTGEVIVPVRDWADFLSPRFRRLTGIKKYYHFNFSTSFPGVVKLQLHSEAMEEQQRLLKDPTWKPDATNLPPVIHPSGLSIERQQYLFERIRGILPGGCQRLGVSWSIKYTCSSWANTRYTITSHTTTKGTTTKPGRRGTQD